MTRPLDFWENSLCGPRRNDAPFYGPEKFSLPYLTMFSFYITSMTLPSHTLAYSVRIPSGTREIEFCRPKYPQKAHPHAPNPISASTPAPPARVPLLHLGTRGLWTLRTTADGGGHGGTGAHDLHHEEERDGGHAQLEGGAPGQRAGRRVRGARAGPLRHGVPRRRHGRPASGPAAPRARWTSGTVARGGAVGGRGGPRQRRTRLRCGSRGGVPAVAAPRADGKGASEKEEDAVELTESSNRADEGRKQGVDGEVVVAGGGASPAGRKSVNSGRERARRRCHQLASASARCTEGKGESSTAYVLRGRGRAARNRRLTAGACPAGPCGCGAACRPACGPTRAASGGRRQGTRRRQGAPERGLDAEAEDEEVAGRVVEKNEARGIFVFSQPLNWELTEDLTVGP